MLFFFMFFLRCFCSCFLAYQSHNNCDHLLLPPTSCSFSYELGGCKCAKTCPFACCLAIVACLKFIAPLLWIQGSHLGIPMGVHASPFGFFCGRHFLHFLFLLWSKLHQIGPLHVDWLLTLPCCVATTASFIFLALFSSSLCFALLCFSVDVLLKKIWRIPKYLVEVITCDL